MPSEILNLTAQIIISHASMTKLTLKELVAETIHDVLVSRKGEVVVPEPNPKVIRQRKHQKVKMKESPRAKAAENEEGLPVGDPDYMEFMESREG